MANFPLKIFVDARTSEKKDQGHWEHWKGRGERHIRVARFSDMINKKSSMKPTVLLYAEHRAQHIIKNKETSQKNSKPKNILKITLTQTRT